MKYLPRRGRLVRRAAGQHLVQHDAEGEQVGAPVNPLALRQEAQVLGRRVLPLPDEHPGARDGAVHRLRLRDAEVDDLHPERARRLLEDHDVLGADVAVDDASLVDRLQAVERLDRDVDGDPRLQPALAPDQGREVRALDVLPHHVEGVVRELGEVVEDRHVLVLDARRQLRFPEEALVQRLVLHQVRPHRLDDADRAQARVQHLVDLAHPAAAETLDDPVLPVDQLHHVGAQEVGDRLAAVRAIPA